MSEDSLKNLDPVYEDFLSSISVEALQSLTDAITATKKDILDSEGNCEHRKLLVKKLIDLRIRKEYVKERLSNENEVITKIKGHTFVDIFDSKASYSNILSFWRDGQDAIYCQVCGTSVFIYVQFTQHCLDCSFYAHQSCVPDTKRECIALKVKTNPTFISQICPERSLSSVSYKCCECSRSFDPMKFAPLLCDYTGLLYCDLCHWRAKGVTPARIIQNWDFTKVLLCQASKQYITLMLKKPIIDIEALNPQLFVVVQELSEIRELRRKVLLMKKYLELCRIASQNKLLLLLSDRQHFVESMDLYTLQDLIDANSGELVNYLTEIFRLFDQHITIDCLLCKAKGFICEICNDTEDTIFPFTQIAHSCEICNCVVHRHCYRSKLSVCPKCTRIAQRKDKHT